MEPVRSASSERGRSSILSSKPLPWLPLSWTFETLNWSDLRSWIPDVKLYIDISPTQTEFVKCSVVFRPSPAYRCLANVRNVLRIENIQIFITSSSIRNKRYEHSKSRRGIVFAFVRLLLLCVQHGKQIFFFFFPRKNVLIDLGCFCKKPKKYNLK